jgi:DNA-binding transcriptional regulator LsrR (DeoR family)
VGLLIAGKTQEEITVKLGVSRQSAQRLVSLAISEGLVKVRLDHPIANCLELTERLKAAFVLNFV